MFPPEVINDIHIKSELGRYRMRGFSLFKKIPTWDDLTFLPGTLTRFVIEGYREKCLTKTVIGPRAKRPLELDIPIYITGMSFGALSYEAKTALARGATMAGTATCSGEGGMIPDERRYSSKWFYQCIQSRYGFNPQHLRLADALRVLHRPGLQGRPRRPPDGSESHRPGGGNALAAGRHRPALAGAPSRLAGPGRSGAEDPGDPRGHRTGRFRSSSSWARRASMTTCAWRPRRDPDSIYIDGMEGGTGAGPHLATEETGVPGIAAIRQARQALDDVGKTGEISLVYAGGIRNGGDVAKALALGADAVAIGHSVDDGAQLQQGHSGGRFRKGNGCRGGLLLPLPHRPLPGRRRHPGSGTAQAAESRRGGGAGLQLPAHASPSSAR